ncbi:Lrp/AsnC family transcriptional regulator [Vibrio sp.]|nr:Lrp/AsnC family transcriptional regulator [Vibrio sp.]
MSNITMQDLDQLDRRIISNLLTDGRASIANLARRIGLSRTAVAERMNRLEKTGIIKGYTAQIRFDKGHAEMTSSYLLIRCTKGKKTEVTDALKEIPEVRSTSVVGGGYDLIVLIEAPDLEAIHFIADEIEAFPGIESIQNTVVLHKPVSR